MSYFQAIVIGLLQGVTELFPISSLGHSVLVPAWLGWDHLVSAQSAGESFFLAFVVALHVATALALLVYFREDWVRIIRAFFRTLRTRTLETPDERMAWLLIVATHPRRHHRPRPRTHAPHPVREAARRCDLPHRQRRHPTRGERVRRRSAVRKLVQSTRRRAARARKDDGSTRSDFKEAGAIGVAQIGALFAGISRSGITMVAGLVRGLDHEDAAALLVPARDTDHLRGGHLQGSRPGRPSRRRHPWPSARRRHLRGTRRLRVRAVPHAVLRDPQPDAVRDLLPRRRRDLDRPLRLNQRAPSVEPRDRRAPPSCRSPHRAKARQRLSRRERSHASQPRAGLHTMLRTAIVVAACLVVVWLELVAFVFIIRPDGSSLRDATRLLPDTLRLVRRLAADGTFRGERVRLVVLLLLYLASPLDLIPDFVPVVGFADDAIITAFALRLVIRRAGPDKLREHWPGSADGLTTLARLLRLPGVEDTPPTGI